MVDGETSLEMDPIPDDDKIREVKQSLLERKIDLRERFRANFWRIVQYGVAGFIVFLLFDIFVFFGLNGSFELFVLVLFIAVILISLVLMGVILQDIHSDLDWIHEKALWAVDKMNELVRGFKRSRLNKFESFAHGLLMHEGPYTIDDYHYIDEITSTFDLTGERTRFKERIEGRNNTARESDEFKLYLETGAETNVSNLDLEIRQRKKGADEAEWVTMGRPDDPDDPTPEEIADEEMWYAEPHGTFGIILHVPFLEPLKPMGHGEGASTFAIEYSLVSGEIPEDRNYQWLPSYRFAQGTGKISIECKLKEDFYADVGMIYDIKVDKSNISPAQLKSKKITEDEEMPVLQSWTKCEKRIYRCEDVDATDSLYIFIVDRRETAS